MTFRLDLPYQRQFRWIAIVKGVQGKGVYGRLETGPDGIGLFSESYGDRERLLDDDFVIPLDVTDEDAQALLAKALGSLG